LDWIYSERRQTVEEYDSGKNGGEKNTRKKKNRYDRRADRRYGQMKRRGVEDRVGWRSWTP